MRGLVRALVALAPLLVLATLARAFAGSPDPLAAAPEPRSAAFEAVLSPGEGVVLRHEAGAQLKILPGTFNETTRVSVAPEELAPLGQYLTSTVWSLEANQQSLFKPIELVLPFNHGAPPEGVETFGIYWDGKHWARADGVPTGDGTGLRVQADHFSLWSVATDARTMLGNAKTVPALLAVEAPSQSEPGHLVTVRFAAANVGASDLDGYGVVSLVQTDRDGASTAVSDRLLDWDGADGSLGSTVYATDAEMAGRATEALLVDTGTLSPLVATMPRDGDLHLQLRLDFFDADGRPVARAVAERVVRASDGVGGAASPDIELPDRVEVVRQVGTPMLPTDEGAVAESFDAPRTFDGGGARDVAAQWGAYQVGVVARFAGAAGQGLENTAAQRIEARGASRLGIFRGVSGLVKGESYRATVSYQLEPPPDAESPADTVRLGVDPSGGADPNSPDVIWVEGHVLGEWASLVLPEVQPNGEAITVFLELRDEGQSAIASAVLDGVEIAALRVLTMPDLTVEAISLVQTGEGQCAAAPGVIRVQVKNQGGTRAPSFNTVVSGAPASCGPWRVRGLDPGEAFVFQCQLSEPGTLTVRAVVDASNAVGEGDENNNWAQQALNVRPVCPPTPTPSPTPAVPPTATATATPSLPTPTPTPVCAPGSPLCLGSQVSFRYLGTDWTISIDGWRSIPDESDKRWVTVQVWGTLVRGRRHDVERLLGRLGDADLGNVLSLTVLDDHGHAHRAESATLTGPLAVESRLLFEDVRDLWGTFTFEVTGFPAPSAVGTALLAVATVVSGEGDGTPLQFEYAMNDGCCRSKPAELLGEPHLSPAVSTRAPLDLMPYLDLELLAAEVSPDGALLTLDLALRNEDYVSLSPIMGRALVINGDWSYGAYLGAQDQEPVSWRDAEKLWAEVMGGGVPPLSDSAPQTTVIRVYALAPKGVSSWQRPMLYLPRWDKAMPLY